MNGHVLPFGGSTHATVDALLPFYVNATLQGEELALVEQHIGECADCRGEVERLRVIFDACKVYAAPSGDTPVGLDTTGDIAAARGPAGLGARIRLGIRAAPPWTKWMLAAQLAAIAVLATLVAGDARDTPTFRTLGNPAPIASAAGNIAVMFDPAIPESEIRRIVRAAGARIVDGPTATDVFVLEIPSGQIDRALPVLRAEPAVRLAESLEARSGR
jgi:hypothetical protein